MGSLSLKDGVWEVTAEPHVTMVMKRMFPRLKPHERGVMRLKHSDPVARDLVWFLSRHGLDMTEHDRFVLTSSADRHKTREVQVKAILSGKVDPRAFPLALPLREYQRQSTDMAYTLRSLLLADDLGTGKTLTGIGLCSMANTRPAVWVTMTHLQIQAGRELDKFLPGVKWTILKKSKPYPLGFEDGTAPDVVITNYAKISDWAEVLAPHLRTLICDEAQELRHADSKRYSAIQHIRERVLWCLCMTSTPIYGYAQEILNVLNIVRPDSLGTLEEFKTAWGGHLDARGRLTIGDPRALGTHLRSEGLMLRRTRQDVGREIPAIFRTVHVVETDPRVLAEIKGSAAELARIILAEKGSGLAKMQAAGEIDRIMRQATGISKAPYVVEFVKLLLESEDRVVVFAWHHAVYDLLEQGLNSYGVARYTGAETTTQKDAALTRFKSGPEVYHRARVLLLSLRAGAGIDGLQHVCRTGVFAELDWSPKVHEQDQGRLARDGQQDSTMFYYLVAAEGSDPVVMDVLQVKTGQADGIVDPDVDRTVDVQVDPNRVRRLAEAVIGKR